MRIGIDVTNFYSGLTNGTPIYLHHLLRALLATGSDLELRLLYAHRPNRHAEQILGELADPRVTVIRTSFFQHGFPSGGWWYPYHPSIETLFGRIDVFHAGDFVWPPQSGIPVVASVLDVSTKLHPETHFWANRWRDGKKLRWVAKQADRILTISEATARDVVKLLAIAPSRVDVVPLAQGLPAAQARLNARQHADRVRTRYGLADAQYVLAVGTLEPRKNHARLVKAFEILPDQFSSVQLVLAGGRGWKPNEFARVLDESPARKRIHVLGFVPAADLLGLYAGATVFAYPSLHEGFGIPLLEAMAAGTPVLTSNVSSLPEVAGDAALLVDPVSVEAIRAGLERLLTDDHLRALLKERGHARERQFTWRRTAELTLESYRKAIAGRAT